MGFGERAAWRAHGQNAATWQRRWRVPLMHLSTRNWLLPRLDFCQSRPPAGGPFPSSGPSAFLLQLAPRQGFSPLRPSQAVASSRREKRGRINKRWAGLPAGQRRGRFSERSPAVPVASSRQHAVQGDQPPHQFFVRSTDVGAISRRWCLRIVRWSRRRTADASDHG